MGALRHARTPATMSVVWRNRVIERRLRQLSSLIYAGLKWNRPLLPQRRAFTTVQISDE